MTTPETDQLRRMVVALEARLGDAEHLIQSLLSRVAAREHPMGQPLFLAKEDGAGFQERTTEDGSTFRDFTDGRASTAAPMTMEAGGFAILEIPGPGTTYFVKLRSTTVPDPTAANQVLISKEDPDNPGQFIWEANWARFHT